MSALHTRTPGIRLGAMPDTSLPFARNVVGMWHFDEGAGNTALDSGLYANHGELVGNVRRALTPRGPALQFDGISSYVSVPHTESLMPSRITVIVRTRCLAMPAQFDCILIKATDGNWNNGYGLWYDSPSSLVKFYVSHSSSGGISQITIDPLAENTFVGTYDGASIRLCANGIAGSTMTYTGGITPTTGPLEFGRGRGDLFTINGFIYQVTILDYALPPDEALRASL